ncbi:type II secretion system minor pseudopilin GspK [Undibacterium cyanobacteriorum]|uniref:Type II secretion system protein K n=1 Tax=Undibacterium cyanobacteriorum TaxID=3073561 RepID=A0ABY9RD52_9BURK|nr:type II secretion system minor pseudopilin GspK [Undibacterium sp. 20NA77.5]WMW79094.1 type II secretion system minor pseudopilin GspK [Undibacterium sp. 20NA77.5]
MHAKQGGVAVVTALLLTTLAITIVASLFWQQQVQVRSIENQRYQLQKKWVLRGALDWASLILREDARTSGAVDHLGEPWAVNLGDTRLDQYVENGKTDVEDSDATLSGKISDAQAKFNLTNLASGGEVDQRELEAFMRLLANLKIDTAQATGLALQVAQTQDRSEKTEKSTEPGVTGPQPSSAEGTGAAPSNPGSSGQTTTKTSATNPVPDLISTTTVNSTVQFLKFSQVDDLLAIPGFTPEIVAKLKNYVTVLPVRTPINVNTTTAEVLSARLENVSMTEAALMIAQRDRAFFRDFVQFQLNFPDKVKASAKQDVSFSSNYFIVNGRVRLNRSFLEVNSLIERNGQRSQILWVKEN